jgi:metal-responsive CopG/Arc/MetJ family transcriptional regulator
MDKGSKAPPRMVKTTIDVPEQMWKDFSIRVIQKYGGRKKNDVIRELIKEYLERKD